MDEAIPKLVFAALLIWLAVVIGAVVLAIIILLIAPASAGLPLYWIVLKRRYTLSRTKSIQCLAIAAIMFLTGFVVTCYLHPEEYRYAPYWFIDWTFPAKVAGIWAGVTLALSIVAVFLCVEVYRQTFWPYRQFALKTNTKIVGLQARALGLDLHAQGVQRRIRRIEKYGRTLLTERETLQRLTDEIMSSEDAAFFAAEIAVWRREYSNLPTDEIRARLKHVQAQLTGLVDSDPRSVTLTLEAATLRLIAIENDLRDRKGVSYDQLRARRSDLSTSSAAVSETISQLQRLRDDARLTVRQHQRASATIQ